ncbi:keratin, type II cytoskeletal 2 epidermal-like [Panicum miliaceum]|uniref:Keratin, type II cytoskeletal 2 epidermal-like n=1 Tax=Panicum miliaceum TaxID=4540 RepID=A0A3L6RAF1_PANMI|nr:keratin, type II cytoskeletal 2 epidermal-like [Panicum miliaceum]
MMMDRQVVRQCDMEVMKMAMLKHEETFRQQVHELHRLYRIQRQLMSDLTRDELVATRRRSKQPRCALNLQLPADEYIVSADEDDEAAGAELELTLAVGGRSAGRRKNNNRRRQEQHGSPGGGGSSPFGSDDCSGASLLSSSPSSAEYYSDEVPAAVFQAPPPPCQRAMAFDLGDGMMRQQAPWLMQCQQYLSLRMT